MTRLETLEEEIKKLNPTEFGQLRDWLLEQDSRCRTMSNAIAEYSHELCPERKLVAEQPPDPQNLFLRLERFPPAP